MSIRIGWAAVFMIAIAITYSSLAWPAYTDISVEQGYQKWLDGVFMLDVRTSDEVAAGFVPGAYNIDVNELLDRLDELDGKENAEIVVYCKAGTRSAKAAAILDAAGFTQLYNMTGGFDAWKAANYSVETGDASYLETTVDVGYAMWLGGVFVLDVRSVRQYSEGHVPDAHCIPASVLATHTDDLAGKEDVPILIYCSGASCGLGSYSAGILAENGFNQLFVMSDGIEGWIDAGYPTQTGLQSTLPLACDMGTIEPASIGGGPWGDLAVLALAIVALGAAGKRRAASASSKIGVPA